MDPTPEQREAIVEAITALDWTAHPDAGAIEAIRASLDCSSPEAAEYLEAVCLADLVECGSESGNHTEPWYHWQTKWKWFRKI